MIQFLIALSAEGKENSYVIAKTRVVNDEVVNDVSPNWESIVKIKSRRITGRDDKGHGGKIAERNSRQLK
jgi:hypothetical protein